ncbi:MAG TPA: hypothetical protein VGK48_18695 [Terriglobia bacterium]|jgi:hypothetical protein
MKSRKLTLVITVALAITGSLYAQRGGGGGGRGGGNRGGAAQPAQAAAPVDITGYWVALVTEDWRWRMITPKKGDFPSIPLNPAGRDLANAWDPAKDEASGDACKSYGAGNVMRLPARFHITWADANTLKVEVDNGNQTRLFHFATGTNAPEMKPNPADPKNWQGNSVASWETAGRGADRSGDLKVVTKGAQPGYLQKNGVPYSANAVFTEYFSKYDEPGAQPWSLLVVSTLTEDPTYLQQPHIRSSHYRKLPDAQGWNPTPCTAQ